MTTMVSQTTATPSESLPMRLEDPAGSGAGDKPFDSALQGLLLLSGPSSSTTLASGAAGSSTSGALCQARRDGTGPDANFDSHKTPRGGRQDDATARMKLQQQASVSKPMTGSRPRLTPSGPSSMAVDGEGSSSLVIRRAADERSARDCEGSPSAIHGSQKQQHHHHEPSQQQLEQRRGRPPGPITGKAALTKQHGPRPSSSPQHPLDAHQHQHQHPHTHPQPQPRSAHVMSTQPPYSQPPRPGQPQPQPQPHAMRGSRPPLYGPHAVPHMPRTSEPLASPTQPGPHGRSVAGSPPVGMDRRAYVAGGEGMEYGPHLAHPDDRARWQRQPSPPPPPPSAPKAGMYSRPPQPDAQQLQLIVHPGMPSSSGGFMVSGQVEGSVPAVGSRTSPVPPFPPSTRPQLPHHPQPGGYAKVPKGPAGMYAGPGGSYGPRVGPDTMGCPGCYQGLGCCPPAPPPPRPGAASFRGGSSPHGGSGVSEKVAGEGGAPMHPHKRPRTSEQAALTSTVLSSSSVGLPTSSMGRPPPGVMSMVSSPSPSQQRTAPPPSSYRGSPQEMLMGPMHRPMQPPPAQQQPPLGRLPSARPTGQPPTSLPLATQRAPPQSRGLLAPSSAAPSPTRSSTMSAAPSAHAVSHAPPQHRQASPPPPPAHPPLPTPAGFGLPRPPPQDMVVGQMRVHTQPSVQPASSSVRSQGDSPRLDAGGRKRPLEDESDAGTEDGQEGDLEATEGSLMEEGDGEEQVDRSADDAGGVKVLSIKIPTDTLDPAAVIGSDPAQAKMIAIAASHSASVDYNETEGERNLLITQEVTLVPSQVASPAVLSLAQERRIKNLQKIPPDVVMCLEAKLSTIPAWDVRITREKLQILGGVIMSGSSPVLMEGERSVENYAPKNFHIQCTTCQKAFHAKNALRNFELHAIFWELYQAHPAAKQAVIVGPADSASGSGIAKDGEGGGGSGANGNANAPPQHRMVYPCNSVSRDVVIFMESRRPTLCNNQKKMWKLQGNLHHDTSLFQGRAWLQIPGGQSWESCKLADPTSLERVTWCRAGKTLEQYETLRAHVFAWHDSGVFTPCTQCNRVYQNTRAFLTHGCMKKSVAVDKVESMTANCTEIMMTLLDSSPLFAKLYCQMERLPSGKKEEVFARVSQRLRSANP